MKKAQPLRKIKTNRENNELLVLRTKEVLKSYLFLAQILAIKFKLEVAFIALQLISFHLVINKTQFQVLIKIFFHILLFKFNF